MNLTHTRSLLVAVCLGLFDLTAATAQAGDTTTQPIKQLNEASDLIHRPEGSSPKQTDAFVHNQIFINAPAKVIWSNLVNAKDWPSWYSNSTDVQITNADEDRLGPKSEFNWKTFGFPVSSRVNEFVPDTRLGWFGDGTGIHAYHTWLIIEKSNGCEVVTEETQNGPAAVAFNLNQPRAMYDAHDWWLAALKVRAERAAGKDWSAQPLREHAEIRRRNMRKVAIASQLLPIEAMLDYDAAWMHLSKPPVLKSAQQIDQLDDTFDEEIDGINDERLNARLH